MEKLSCPESAYEFVAGNPGKSIRFICVAIDRSHGPTKNRLNRLRDAGRIVLLGSGPKQGWFTVEFTQAYPSRVKDLLAPPPKVKGVVFRRSNRNPREFDPIETEAIRINNIVYRLMPRPSKFANRRYL